MPTGLAQHSAFLPAVGLAHAALLACLVVVVWRRRDREGRDAAGVFVAALLWGPLALVGLGPRIPVSWLSPVREGFTEAHLEAVAATGLHAGPLLRGFWFPLLLPDFPTLRDAVALDLALAGVAVALLVAIVRRTAGHDGWTAALVLGFLVAPSTWSAALGETSATAIWCYGLLGVQPLVAWRDPDTPRGTARIAGLALGLLAGLAALARVEVLALGAAALLAGVLRTRPGARAERAWSDGFAWVERTLVQRPFAAFALLAAGLGWLFLAEWVLAVQRVDLRVFGQWTWALYAASPLNTRAFTLPVFLLAALPVGIVALALRGSWRALRAPFHHAWLPVVLLWTWGTWWLAAHGGLHGQSRPVSAWELWRYALLATPWVVVLAAVGARGLAWRSPAAALVLLCLLPALPRAARLLGPAWAEHPRGLTLPRAGPVDQDAQREVRALLARWEAAPGCAIVTWAQPWDRPVAAASMRWSALVPWRGGVRARHADLPWDAPVAEVLDALDVTGLPCAVAWQGLDCAILDRTGAPVGDAGCAQLRSWPPLALERWEHRPFVHPAHGGTWPDMVEVGWRQVPGVSTGWAPR